MKTSHQFIERKNNQFQNELKNNITKTFKDINRKGSYKMKREAWTFLPQHNIETKVFVIERFKRVGIKPPVSHPKLKIGDLEYRISYYIVGKIGNRKNKWTWGQSCALIPQKDLNKLLEKAKKEKIIL